jgi:nucleotide-binding universal stress UspA family protein
MDKKILIAVDGSSASQRAVDYVGLMEGAMIRGLRVTLFFVMNPVPPFMRREGASDPEMYRRTRQLEKKNLAQAQEVLEEAKARLVEHGMDEGRVETKALPRASDPARDILFEAEQGMYDALVMGRRGLSKAQELFVGSVTNKVVQHAERLPLWIVGGRVSSLKVLCAVDGSEGALKAVDHLGFMLGHNPETEISLFHVGASLANYCPLDFEVSEEELAKKIEGDIMTGEAECMDDFMVRAVKVLEDGGLGRDQIKTVNREGGLSVPAAIVDEAAKGGYGTIVLGRRGESRSFFLGHVSDKVLGKAADAAVWIVG